MDIGLISQWDASVWVAAISAFAGLVAALIAAHNSRSTKRELRPDGGKSAFDRMEHRFADLEVVLGEHGALLDRLIAERAHDKADRVVRQAELDAHLGIIEKQKETP